MSQWYRNAHTTLPFTPTVTLDDNQQEFVNQAQNSEKTLLCSHVAGGGKTTLVEHTYHAVLPRYGQHQVGIACLNKHNQEDLAKRLPQGAMVKTYSSWAWGAVVQSLGRQIDRSNWKPCFYKYDALLGEFAARFYQSQSFTTEQWEEIEMVKDLRAFCHNTLTDPTNWKAVQKMAYDYDLSLPKNLAFAQQALPTVCQWGIQGVPPYTIDAPWAQGIAKGYDYSELAWFACQEEVRVPNIPLLLTDERQDCNAAQTRLLERMQGRQLNVGDPDQQLYAFTGSTLEGWQELASRSLVVDSPITYRCPRAVVEVAQYFVPRIQAWKEAGDGTVESLSQQNLIKMLRPGDVFVTKTNADAISLALACIREGKVALVKGRSIGNDMLGLFETLERQKDFTFEETETFLSDWLAHKIKLAQQQRENPEGEMSKVQDRANGLSALYIAARNEGIDNAQAFRIYILQKFSDNLHTKDVILVSTIWKFKGYQNPRIFVYEEDVYSQIGTRLWQQQQSKYASYVAVTRSQESLFLVHGKESLI